MKGICFIEPLHNMVVQGIKIQTRRIITPQPSTDSYCLGMQEDGSFRIGNLRSHHYDYIRPRYKIGEKLYLKEPYFQPSFALQEYESTYIYRYSPGRNTPLVELLNGKARWENKLFMPEIAARYWIEITNVKIERLHDISHSDCISEGIHATAFAIGTQLSRTYYCNLYCSKMHKTSREAYQQLINAINGKDTWELNPFVFVYDFKLTAK